MFVILTYDVNKKRDPKMLKICRRYLKPVQRSVLEGMITEAKLKKLKAEIRELVHTEEDSVNIYLIENLKFCAREQIGAILSQDNIL